MNLDLRKKVVPIGGAQETTGLIEDSVNRARKGADVAARVGKARAQLWLTWARLPIS